MNCLIENEYIFTNDLPNWKRIHKVNFLGTLVFTNELPNWKRMHKVNFLGTLVFTNELPNWKRIHKVNFLERVLVRKGFNKEIDHLSLVDFLHSRTFQARFGVWSLLLPAQRVLRASERVWERVQLGKELRNKFN